VFCLKFQIQKEHAAKRTTLQTTLPLFIPLQFQPQPQLLRLRATKPCSFTNGPIINFEKTTNAQPQKKKLFFAKQPCRVSTIMLN
jgi:hypothetical protein